MEVFLTGQALFVCLLIGSSFQGLAIGQTFYHDIVPRRYELHVNTRKKQGDFAAAKIFFLRGIATDFVGDGVYNGGKDFKFGFVGLIRNSQFVIRNCAGKKTNMTKFLPRFSNNPFWGMIFCNHLC